MNKTLIGKPTMTKEEYELIVEKLENKKLTIFSKRIFDLIVSLIMAIVLSPLLIILSLAILIDSGSPVFFRQERIGKEGKIFKIFKFRTMKNNSATTDGITMSNDNRITKIGVWLRKYRLDELPQLFNIIGNEMSFVGPRPDLPKYYETSDYGYKCALLVKPGITGEATLKFRDEDKMLSLSNNPEKTYTEEIFPQKVRLNIDYIKRISLLYDLNIMVKTFIYIFIK